MDTTQLVFILLAIVLVVLVAKGPQWWQARRLKGKQITVLADVLPESADIDGRYLFYFWSPTCNMCLSSTAIIERLKQVRDDIISVNAFEHMELVREMGVMGTPAFVVVDKQAVEQLIFGGLSEKKIIAMLD